MEAYEAAVRTQPGQPDVVAHAYVNIGSILTDHDERLSYYRKAVMAHPGHPHALNNVGMLTEDSPE